jgi:Ni,Fe-hydrogenase III large subunit
VSADENRWRIDRKIPVVALLSVAAYAAGTVYIFAKMDQRLYALEQHMIGNQERADRLTRVEVRLEGIKELLQRIDAKVDQTRSTPSQDHTGGG